MVVKESSWQASNACLCGVSTVIKLWPASYVNGKTFTEEIADKWQFFQWRSCRFLCAKRRKLI